MTENLGYLLQKESSYLAVITRKEHAN
jgi:hypothetical protein